MTISAAATTAAATASLPLQLLGSATETAGVPWHQKIRRVGQTNFTEHDPVVLSVEEWANYWASLKVDAVLVSITGILAFYPSKVPFHKQGRYLNGRDLAGECIAAAKRRKIRVVARLSPDLNWGDALAAQGNALAQDEDPRLYETCIFTSYMTDYIPAIIREVNERYPIDAIFTNAWPPIGEMPECYCSACKNLPAYSTPAYWEKFNARVVYLWKLYDSIAREKSPDNVFLGNMGGAIASGPNLKDLEGLCSWFNCDNQGRGGEGHPIWGCTLQGRVSSAVMKGRTSTNVTAAWSTGKPRWRNIHKSSAEAQMWMNETVASGMVPWYHFIGGEDGLGADRRWQKPGRDYFAWLSKHDKHLTNKASLADIAVVMGQRTQRFYHHPSGDDAMRSIHGLYYALLEGRFLFDFVHEDDLDSSTLKKYTAVLLPNIALLSDAQCAELKCYVESGGSLMASFETGMYNERNERRAEFGLGDVFGIHAVGAPKTSNGNGYMARIERGHAILDGFSDTDWIPGAEYLLPIAAIENPVLTVVPPYVAYPPELSYPPTAKTDTPAVVVKEAGKRRLIYFPGDIERTAWESGNTDLSHLLQNAIRWVSAGKQPATIEGDGLAECFAWETEAGFAVHILNYTNPNTHKGWIHKFYAIGEQRVKMRIPDGTAIARVELLRAQNEIPFNQSSGVVEFIVPKIEDYEIAALHAK